MDGLLSGKKGVVFGIANDRSIGWAIAELAEAQGAEVGIGVQNERMARSAEKLLDGHAKMHMFEADLNLEEDLERVHQELKAAYGAIDFMVHSVAFALREDLAGRFIRTSREGFRVALETSAYSFVAAARALESILNDDASLLTMTYLGSQRVLPGYNVMGVAKAALEASTRYLAYDLGERGIRVNAVSPGPINTVSARGIKGFSAILNVVGERVPLKRPAEQEQVATTSLYLLSDLSRGVTGQTLYVDSGYSSMGS
ncbi:MAG: enoyl-ACP reductase [Armatimonadetes bacterium]|nr:enoyl-ACP reductase [Armatimonadota bacterium]